MEKYIEKILSARVYDVADETPLDLATNISRRLGNRVLLKREDKQQVFSFKIRGAYNCIYQLTQNDPSLAGVICASAGNHAQGVALGATMLGLKSIIVMPRTTPAIKIEAVKNFGGKVMQHGDTFDEALEYALKQAEERGYVFVPPFDHPDVIAGQGTVGMEICRQHADPIHTIFVPIGGGGLAAGIAVFVKYLRPDVQIIGVESEDSACMQASLKRGRRTDIGEVGIFADGVAVRIPGKETFRLCRRLLDAVVTCTVDEMCAAIRDIYDDTRTLVEPSGALALAGLKKYVAEKQLTGASLVAITSGANVNFDRLRHVAERAEVGEQREALMAVELEEQPGAFRKFCQTLGRRAVTEFNYRYSASGGAVVFVGVRLSNGDAERQDIIDKLREAGYGVTDLTEDETAKLHVRYMIGGRVPSLEDEILVRFQFPERPGALSAFLNKLARGWNISLFHYRNHGAAYGRVLCGIQVPEEEHPEFNKFLDTLGYSHRLETSNLAYKAFLR
ncbi:MAG: threonine ammonia-lyase, biosynthetic [Granulosicoccaceae bacterium]